MARTYRIALVLLASLALCTAAWAQPGPGGPSPGRRPGGPFGMRGRSLSMMYGFLLNAPTVQKDLELTDEQKAKVKDLNEKTRAAMREMFAGMRDLSQEERRAKMAEMGKKMQARLEETQKEIDQILLPHQLQRLKGIALQRAGVQQTLNDKQIQQDLKLSADQLAKIKSINEDTGKKMGELFAGGGDRRENFQKAQEIRKDAEKQLADVLTADQKASLEKMKGEKLDIPNSELTPRGFGRRGGRPPAQ